MELKRQEEMKSGEEKESRLRQDLRDTVSNSTRPVAVTTYSLVFFDSYEDRIDTLALRAIDQYYGLDYTSFVGGVCLATARYLYSFVLRTLDHRSSCTKQVL